MQYLIGFIIALFIALTGVGAGTVTVPVLVLILGVPAPVAVGIGLMFATAVKVFLVPAHNSIEIGEAAPFLRSYVELCRGNVATEGSRAFYFRCNEWVPHPRGVFVFAARVG